MLNKMRKETTGDGRERYVVCTKNSPAVCREFIELSAREMKKIRWTVDSSKIFYAQDDWGRGKKGRITTSTTWTAQDLLDRIDNPETDDNWKAGDVNAALVTIGVTSQHGAVTSLGNIEGISLWAE